ncbi:MAG: hypothetical protein DDT42_02125 [candidate division WS2 bacterium]|uniref:DUF1468 domain-containing protein n=1 Tax=Psychracetigena formicireducens TaxID=2986056 RepID=A0A9E2BIK4_PSYF1|nr:hypothetical protein [Candidatus Psychracetigena formicireducens]
MQEVKVQLYASVLFLVFGIAMLVGSLAMGDLGLVGAAGPGVMPKITSIALIGLSVGLLIQSWTEMKSVKTKGQEETARTKVDKKTVFGTIVILLVYSVMIVPLGFMISSIFYIFCQSILLRTNLNLNKKQIIIIALISVIVSFVINYVFTEYFALALPRGILG